MMELGVYKRAAVSGGTAPAGSIFKTSDPHVRGEKYGWGRDRLSQKA